MSLRNEGARESTAVGNRDDFSAEWNRYSRLDDTQWDRVLKVLSSKVRTRANNGGNTRQFVESVLWVAHTRARWSDLPDGYEIHWHCCYVRFWRWAKLGKWDQVRLALTDLPESASALESLVDRQLFQMKINEFRKTMKQDAE